MQSKCLKRTLALLTVVAMAFTFINFGAFTNAWAANSRNGSKVSFTKVDNRGSGLFFASKEAAEAFEREYIKQDGTVRVSIVLEGESTLEAGFSTTELASNPQAVSYRNNLRAEQDKVAARISGKVLGGEKLDVVWNLTIAGNIISANVPFDKIDAISKTLGVKKVVIETKYEAPVAEESDEPQIAVSATMIGTELVWAEGYTGAGSKIAIIDTGIDYTHELFDPEAFEYALSLNEKQYALLGAEDIDKVIDKLHISEKIPGVTAEDLYIDSKIPFAANYIDNDLQIDHRDGTDGHGSHVAGIAAGNRFVERDGEYVSAIEEVSTQGEAPDAQLVIMKVFGKGGGAYSSDYMVAIEDAFVLGCDAVNLSLGSAAAGFATSDVYEDIVQSFADSDTVVSISAGNASSWAAKAGEVLYYDDVNFSMTGSPGSFSTPFTVASVDNGNFKFIELGDGDYRILYTETQYNNKPFSTLEGQDLDFIYLDKVGTPAQWNAAGGSSILRGKVAIVNRGAEDPTDPNSWGSFVQKITAAYNLGAIAVVIANNQSGVIGMDLSSLASNITIPAVSIQADDAYILKYFFADPVKDDNGNVLYYEGTFRHSHSGEGEYMMSDFSSWGVPGDLSLKPEISAPGGDILSVQGDPSEQASGTYYVSYSGTSMASPQIAGLSAVLAQYIKDNGLAEKFDISPRALITSLLMSTAHVNKHPVWTDQYTSVMKQGAGIADVNAAINAKSYITIDTVVDTAPKSAAKSIADGKVKVELGSLAADDFTIQFTVHNMGEEPIQLRLSADFFTQEVNAECMFNETVDIEPFLEWTVNGEEFEPADPDLYDFNGDGIANSLDAEWLLRYLVDYELEFDSEDKWLAADFDGDGDIDSYDAKLAFEYLGSAYAEAAEGDTVITLTVSNLNRAFSRVGADEDYIEGYIFVNEGSTEEGELGVTHSIPVFGFHGDWSAHDMFDKGSYVEFMFEEEDRLPYMGSAVYTMTGDINAALEMLNNQSYIAKLPDGSEYYLGGNPLDLDAKYMPERNAISSEAVLKGFRYTLIRNAGATRFEMTDKYGRYLIEADLGPEYAAYYNPNTGNWYNYAEMLNIGVAMSEFEPGDSFTVTYRAAPEYYLDDQGNVDWSKMPEEFTSVSLPLVVDGAAPFIVGAEISEEAAVPSASEGGTILTISAHDEQYIAAVALYTENGDFLDYYGSIADIRKGEQYDYKFNLTELFGDEEIEPHLLVEVYDYALNLSTYKINLNTEELENPEFAVKITYDQELTIVNKGSLQLGYDFRPWGYPDETVFWTTSDESIAVVNSKGLVTSVYEGDEETTVDITATAAVAPEVSDTVTIRILPVEKELNGIVWDESGNVWISSINTRKIPEYEKLNEEAYDKAIAVAARGFYDNLYVATSYPGQESALYLLDEDTMELTFVGNGVVQYSDLCGSMGLSYAMRRDVLVAPYGTYLLLVNGSTGGMLTAIDMTQFNVPSLDVDWTDMPYIAGVTYAGTWYSSSDRAYVDMFLFIDQDGYVHEIDLAIAGGRVTLEWLEDIGQFTKPTQLDYWQSFYYSEEDNAIYMTRFESEAKNVVEMYYAPDIVDEDGYIGFDSVYNIGTFDEGVWPVAGLYEPIPAEETDGGHSTKTPMADLTLVLSGEDEIMSRDVDQLMAAFNGRHADQFNKVVTTVKVDILADQLTTNGMIDVYYPVTAEIVSITCYAEHYEYKIYPEMVRADNSTIVGYDLVLAFVDLEGIAAGDKILTVEFASGSTGEVDIYTYDINRDDDENFTYDAIILGPIESYHSKHVYEVRGEWNWYVDETDGKQAASVVLGCVYDDIDEFEVEAEITSELVGGKLVYTATVEIEDQIFTDTLELPVAAINGRSGNFGVLGVNFLLNIDESYFEDGDVLVVITKGIGEEAVDFEYLASECVSGTRYKFTVPTAVKEMADALTLRVYTEDGSTLIPLFDKEGNDVTDTGYVFSMKDYCKIAVAQSSNPDMVALAEAYLDFGYAAMIKFDHNAELAEDFALIDDADYSGLAEFAENITDDSLATVASSTATATFDSLIKLNKYFTFEQGTDVSGYKFYLNGNEVEATRVSATKYLIEVEGIAIKDFDVGYEFSVVDEATGDAYTVEYCVLSYFYKALTSDKATPAMVDLAKAGYNVYLAAEQYFG